MSNSIEVVVQFAGKEKVVELQPGQTVLDLSQKINFNAPDQSVSCAINGKLSDLFIPLNHGDKVVLYSFNDQEGKDVFWHTSAHVLAQAILRIWPEALPTIGPPIENGFYYDFANLTISDTDFERIEEEVHKVLSENYKSERYDFKNTEEAIQAFSNNPYKVEMIRGFAKDGSALSGYRQGEFFDLCRGPHMASLGKIRAFKLLKTSGAYWRADSNNEMLTRVYGISFPDKKLLKEYLFQLEEAKKRDHKILGPKLDLFSLKEEAPGIPFIHHKGMIIWNRLLDYWRSCHKRLKYIEIKTPTMMVRELWERSGHWANYRENMFTSTIEEREFAIKPMNCPGAMLFYKSTHHSYRDLPLKVAEVGQVHRFEPSGSLSGLFRVRSFHQDDAHIFCTLEQIQESIHEILGLVHEIYSTFGLKYALFLATRPDKQTIGTDEEWQMATDGLKNALNSQNLSFTINEGDGAFYGPKIDIRVFDALGRMWQCATIQLDMALPERFDLEYMASDGTKKRPVLIHRVIYGSIERFIGSLIEFYAGRFPLWISPSQIRIIPVSDKHNSYAEEVAQYFLNENFEVTVDTSNESVGKKVREAQILQYNYVLTVGDKEVENTTVALRTRDGVVHGEMTSAQLLESLKKERAEKALKSPFQKESA